MDARIAFLTRSPAASTPLRDQPSLRAVRELVAQMGEASPAQVAEKLDIPPNQVRTYLARLVDSGRLMKRGRGLYATDGV